MRLELLKDFSFGVVAKDFDIDETAQVELFSPEHGHLGGVGSVNCPLSK